MKKVNFVSFVLFCIVVGMTVSSCATSSTASFTTRFMSNAPVTEQAILVSDPYFTVYYIDNVDVRASFMKTDIKHYYVLAPGTHRLVYQFEGSQSLRSNPVTTTANFDAGKVYSLTGMIIGDKVSFSLDEVTNMTEIASARSAVEEEVAKASSQTVTPWSLRYVTNEPTKFEGTWKAGEGSLPDYSGIEFQFTNNTYVLISHPTSVRTANFGHRGNFSFTADTFTLYSRNGYVSTLQNGTLDDIYGWPDVSSSKNTLEFGYVLNGDLMELYFRKEHVANMYRQ